jgi:hypothetical protein
MDLQGNQREKLGGIQWSERERGRELLSKHLGENGRSKPCDHWREKRRYKYLLGPNGLLSAIVPHPQHCR